jgi:cupin 2 domain-containing protein
MEVENLFAHISRNLPDELCEVIGGNTQIRIERIVSRGHCSEPGFW